MTARLIRSLVLAAALAAAALPAWPAAGYGEVPGWLARWLK